MVNFTIEEIQQIMNKQDNIRNITVIAHVDHGKSTLTDSLICKAGIISQRNAGEQCFTHGRQDEKDRGITIKSTGVSLYYDLEINKKKEPYLINLIDSPGHVDFSSEVTAALRVTDGALVVVDCIEGVCVQTGTVLRQSMQEMIKPVLIINKLDRAILELNQDGEAIYQNFIKVIDSVNNIIDTYSQEIMGELTLKADQGQIAFGSGKQQWAFTLSTFARIYSEKFKIDENKLMKYFWGENYFDPITKKWKNNNQDINGKLLNRGFVQFIMDPICKIAKAIMQNDQETIQNMLQTIKINLNQEERQQKDKELLKTVFSKWLNAADTLLEMIIVNLPSPQYAQKYRTSYLYTGPQDDQIAKAMRECDPQGPLIIYISKMVPSIDKGRFVAFGRVFSGTVSSGQKVRILGPNYIPGSKEDLFEKNISRTLLMQGNKQESITYVPCGNTVGLVGLDQFIQKTATITDSQQAHTIKSMKYSVSPVVRVAVGVKNPSDLPKLVEGLNKLSKSDPLVVCSIEETGEHIVAGCGELHVEICLNDLEEYVGSTIIRGDPVVTYKETVTQESNQVCLAKSPNKHNRLFGKAVPLQEGLCEQIEKGLVNAKDDPKERAKYLNENFGWDRQDAGLKLWSFGPENTGPNLVVDMTKGQQYINDIRDSVDSAWQWVTSQAALTEEGMRGVRINLLDCLIHKDNVHRGMGQIVPAARNLFYACELTAEPRLQEPIFSVEIQCPNNVMGGVYNCLNQRRGIVTEEEQILGTPMNIIKCYLPVAESFGFTAHLRSATQGQAFPQCSFDHWDVLQGSPFDKGSKSYQTIIAIRKRKGLKDGLPELNDYLDKL